jgi:hypothetical protein
MQDRRQPPGASDALFFLTPVFQSFIPGLSTFNLLVPGIVIGIMILREVGVMQLVEQRRGWTRLYGSGLDDIPGARCAPSWSRPVSGRVMQVVSSSELGLRAEELVNCL